MPAATCKVCVASNEEEYYHVEIENRTCSNCILIEICNRNYEIYVQYSNGRVFDVT
jgi:hypothetical protein